MILSSNYKIDLFTKLLRIRKIEEKIASEYKKQEMRCPIHLSIGQESVAVSICSQLKKKDLIVSGHRAHAHYLAKGGSLKKMISEMYLKYFHKICGMKTLSLRLSNIYGPTDRLEIFSRVVLNKISIKAYNEQQIHIFNNSKCKRDFIYIDDVINAFLFTIFLTDKFFNGNHFVIGSGETTTFDDLSIKLINKKENIKIIKDEKTQMHLAEYRDFVADSSLFSSKTNWKSKVKLDEGLNRTLDFIKNNKDKLK